MSHVVTVKKSMLVVHKLHRANVSETYLRAIFVLVRIGRIIGEFLDKFWQG
jgi:hypothetical protein